VSALALEGSFASVIGGAPAAAVVFPASCANAPRPTPPCSQPARPSKPRTPRAANGSANLERALKEARARAQAAVAREFDQIHSVDRALQVGSLDAVIAPRTLRPALIARVRGDTPAA
jgi:hypothetical protein